MKYRNHNRYTAINSLKQQKENAKLIKKRLNEGKDQFIEDEFYTVGQTWGGLIKAWYAYYISKMNNELDRMIYYANVIQKLQNQLKLPLSSFPDLDMMGLGYLADNAYIMNGELTGEEIRAIVIMKNKDKIRHSNRPIRSLY